MAIFTRLLALTALVGAATAYTCAKCPATIGTTTTYYVVQQSSSIGSPTYCGYAVIPCSSSLSVTYSADGR